MPPSPEASAAPLEGVRILDLSDSIAGAYCAKMLADSGADVLKVEAPGAGDPLRDWNPAPYDEPAAEPGMLFWYLNANKRGITLNVAEKEGRELLRRLLHHSEIIVETRAPERARELGLTYAALGADAEHLIWLSVTPFGQTGPYAAYRATDLVIQAASGWMGEGGAPDREPLKTGGTISEYITGTWGALAVMAAWMYRQETGEGQQIDLAAFEAMQSTSGYQALAYSSTGVRRTRRVGQGYPFGIFRCKDGWVGVNILTPGHWEMLCRFMERPELCDDPRFATPLARRENAPILSEMIADWTGEHTQAELFGANEWRLPITLLPTVSELLAFPQHEARGYFVEQQLGALGAARRPGAPFKMSATPFQLRRTAPALGEHNDDIFRDLLRLTDDEIEQLRRRGII